MKYCIHCGKQLNDTDAFCVYCGSQQGVNCPAPYVSNSNQNYVVNNQTSQSSDYLEMLWAVVSFFCFWVGIIAFLQYRERKPTTAKYCLIGSMVNLGLSLIMLIVGICVAAATASF